MRVENKFLIAVMLVIFCANYAKAVQPLDVDIIAKTFTGSATPLQRLRVAELINLLVDMSQRPEHIVLTNIIDTGSAKFNPPHCFLTPNGARACTYNEWRFPTSNMRFNNLRTFTLKTESDAGAEVSLEIAPEFACISSHIFSKVWELSPVEALTMIPEYFGGSGDLPTIRTEVYRGINPSVSYMYAEVKSISKCVISVHLSVVKPPNY